MYRSHPNATSTKSASTFYGFSSAGQIQNPPSLSSTSNSKSSDGPDVLSPDELFTRHTVSEVKIIQQRLRHDAEVKQEELRLMVGERYRDLIHASSSIVSMGTSSQRVLSAFEESKAAILAQKEPPLPSHSSAAFGGVNDRHLHALQTLSAHLKVLLDAPEHLWRFIEKKKYLSAAWLFLFIRVVHRALVQQDDDEEDSWMRIGVDVLIEFPLVQRQWDEVSTFRSQVIHKATLSLRETSTSAHDVCATLTALHLLDSRPLSETFAALLKQRSKALAPLIAWRKEHDGSIANDSSRTRSVKEIQRANEDVLSVIADTISKARQVFQVSGDQKHSLVTLLLKSIQSESENDLPDDLVISTHSLLINSTSSAHFLLLPPNLQSYRPYVDLSSASTTYSRIEFDRALESWFAKSSNTWQDAANAWFTNLTNVSEVWEVRGALRKRIQTSDLEPSEKEDLHNILDTICRSRILTLWKGTLSSSLTSFQNEMSAFLSKSRERGSTGAHSYLKIPPPPATAAQGSKVVNLAPFHRYQESLKRHLLGRAAQLDTVLSTLEGCARNIQQELAIVFGDDTESGKSFSDALAVAYQPEAESTADSVASSLAEAVENAANDSDKDRLVGLAKICDDLGSLSTFISHIGCRSSAIQAFKSRLADSLDVVVQEWLDRTIDDVLEIVSDVPTQTTPSQALGPSPRLFQSLLSLCEALRGLGVRPEYARHQPIVQRSLRLFIERLLADGPQPPHAPDLYFLKAIADIYGPDWTDITDMLSDSLDKSSSPSSSEQRAELEKIAAEHLARTQTLLSILLPCSPRLQLLSSTASTSTAGDGNSSSTSHFLLFNTPSSKQEYQSALEVAKPSPRFGLLLVNSADKP